MYEIESSSFFKIDLSYAKVVLCFKAGTITCKFKSTMEQEEKAFMAQ